MRHLRLFENAEDLLLQIKNIIDENQYVQDKNVTADKVIESKNWIIYISKQTMEHIEAHLGPSVELGDAPGSYYTKDWKSGLQNVISNYEPQTSDKPPFRTAWVGLDSGKTVGYVTIGLDPKLDSNDISGYKKYSYDRPIAGKQVKETIIVKEEEATSTRYLTVVGAKIGEVNGKGLISLWTTYPDFEGGKINGKDIPMDRNQFEQNGFYFKCTPEFYSKIPTNESMRYLKSFKNF